MSITGKIRRLKMIEKTNGYLSVTDVSKILDISREVVNSWLRKGYIEYALTGNLRKIRPEYLLEYLKKLGNSPGVMINFKESIENYLIEKNEMKKFKRTPFEDFKKAEKYINEAKNQEERAKRFAKVKNYIEGTGPKPWENIDDEGSKNNGSK